MITVNELQYNSYGRCVCISNGTIEVYVTLDFGPRIIRCGFVGGENFMKEDNDFSIKIDLGNTKFNDNIFYNRGGHRCWMSPEAFPGSYYPDNKAISYEQKGDMVVFTQSEQEGNEVQLSFEITMSETSNSLEINHVFVNTSYWAKEFAVWPLTVVAPNGIEYIPQNIVSKGFLPNRNLAMWTYSSYNDPRLSLGDKYITVSQNPDIKEPFKLGLAQDRTWAAYFHHGDMFVKKYSTVEAKQYPDFGCTYETYTNGEILEMETLGHLKKVNPGEANSHKETWLLFKDVSVPANDFEMDQIADKYNLE